MDRKPTYDELESRVKELEKELRDAKRAEEILWEAENLEQLLKVAPFGIFLIDLSGKIVACNENGAERLGKPIETAVGTVLRDYFPPKVSENRRLKGMEAIQSGHEITFEDQVEGRWYRNSIVPFFDKEGKPLRLAIYGADVTEYKNTVDALEKSEEKYRQLAELLPQVVFEIDEKGNITFANRISFDLFGYTRANFEKGVNALQMLIPEDRERAVENIQKVLRGENSRGSEYTALKKDGRTFPVMLYSNPIMREGEPVGLRGIMVDLTEIRQAQEALRESEERWQFALEGSRDGVWDWNAVTNEVFFSRRWKEMLGYNGDEISNHLDEWDKRVHPDDREQCYADLNKHLNGEVPYYENEHRMLCKDGSYKWILDRGKVFSWTESHKPQRAIGTHTDITERKRVEQKLRESQELLENILTASAVGIAHARDRKIIWANQAMMDLFGFTEEDQYLGQDTKILYADEGEYRRVGKAAYDQQRTGNVMEIDAKLKRRDGSLFDGYVKVNILDPLDPIKGIIVSIIDITDRKKAENALRESEEKFRSLGQNAPDIIYTLTFDGSFTYVNPAWKAILGYEPKEILGKHFIDFVKEEEAREYVRIFKNIRDNRETFKDIEVNIIHKDGSTRLFSASGAPNINTSGEVTGMVGLFKDITEHRRLEARFRQSQRMEAIGTLAGGIAHDFNNLLMGIQGRTSLMLTDIGPSQPHLEHLKGIEDYVKSAADLTKQLLGFARGGKYEVKPIDINELLKTGSRMFGRTKKEIQIHLKLQKEVWTIEADQGQIEQVLLNLYVNAWQAMPSGGELYLQTENVYLDKNYVKPFEIEPGRYVKISVTDTGVGMDKETRQRVFDPFFTTKEMGRGTGLGLASAYGIIKNHGGFINVYSERGEGATFNIYLPASEKEVIEEKELPEDLLKGSETVLFVDDEEMIIEIGEQFLKKLGYEVFVASGGKEAIGIFENNMEKIDIVILDMIMPDMSGGDTFDRLREIKPDIKVVLSSGYSINGKATEILDKGCDGFIQKPFNMKQLSRKLRDILDKK